MSFFFFQAEDGIRDLVRSRGLGDVYKRQLIAIAISLLEVIHRLARPHEGVLGRVPGMAGMHAVSYTHLTLPTSDLV